MSSDFWSHFSENQYIGIVGLERSILGTSGLIVAYREAAIDALAHCEEVTQQIEEIVTYDFTYPMMNDVMRIVKDMNPRILDQTFDNTCSIKLSIRKSEAEQLRSRLKKLSFE